MFPDSFDYQKYWYYFGSPNYIAIVIISQIITDTFPSFQVLFQNHIRVCLSVSPLCTTWPLGYNVMSFNLQQVEVWSVMYHKNNIKTRHHMMRHYMTSQYLTSYNMIWQDMIWHMVWHFMTAFHHMTFYERFHKGTFKDIIKTSSAKHGHQDWCSKVLSACPTVFYTFCLLVFFSLNMVI